MKKRRFDMWLDVDLWIRLKNIDEEIGVPMAESIRRAITIYLKRHNVEKEKSNG